MFRRIKWMAVLYTFLWLISLSGLVVLMSFIEEKKDEVKCSKVKVLIPGNQSFIERTEVDHIIQNAQGPLIGKVLNRINIHLLEKSLKANPYVEDARVFTEMNGEVSVYVKQREPVLRILNYTNQDFYLDRNGLKIPLSENFTANVLVANGFIMESFKNNVDTVSTKTVRDLFATAVFISQDSLWNNQIEQLFVNQQGDIEMVPRVGNQKIVLGSADNLKRKFENLRAFYMQALPKVGWDAYKTISIKYADQVVGVKNSKTDSLNLKAIISVSTPIGADSVKTIQDTINITH